MTITKEMYEKRKKGLEQRRIQLQNEFNAVLGATQDCNYWIAELSKPEPEKKKEKK